MTEQDWRYEFSDMLLNSLNYANMTQIDLARATGLSAATISAYVNGEKTPKVSAVLKIAYALDVDVAELIDFGEVID